MSENAEKKSVPAFIPLVAGGISGVSTRFFCQPLEVVKIRFQLQVEPINRRSSESKYKSLPQACRLIYREEGLRAFWRGHVPAQGLSLTYGVVLFGLFDFLVKQSQLHPTLAGERVKVEFVSGFIGGSAAALISFPFDVIHTRMIAQGHPRVYDSVYQALVLIWRYEGLRGYYRGLTPALIQIGPLTGLNFAIFNHFKRNLDDKVGKDSQGLVVSGHLLTGSMAGFISKLIMYPMDLSRKRMQIQGFQSARVGFGKNFTCNSLVNCLVQTIRGERTCGLFKGLFPSLLKATVVSGLTFTIYESTHSFLCKLYEVNNY